uniref:Uncharacterized protein n=1 Tax=Graphocephala atropunctata TaxID=36148 RepID=A0A1B6LJZ5_9HEMI
MHFTAHTKRQTYGFRLSSVMRIVLALVLLSVAAADRLLLEKVAQDDSALDTGVSPAPRVKGWPGAVCRCICDVTHSVYKFSKRCYGKVRRLCCNRSPKVAWHPMKEEEERMDFNIGKRLDSKSIGE